MTARRWKFVLVPAAFAGVPRSISRSFVRHQEIVALDYEAWARSHLSDRDPGIRSTLPQFWIFPANHPTRQALDRRSVSCHKRGPFLLYRMK